MLKTKVIGDFTVTEAGPIEAARSVNYSAQYSQWVKEAQDKGDDATEDDLERLQALSVWMTVGAVVHPRQSADDWLSLPLTLISQIHEAATELNPTWFELAGPATEKKRKSKPIKSISG